MSESSGRLATDILISVLQNVSLKHSDIRSAEETKQLAENISQMYSIIYQRDRGGISEITLDAAFISQGRLPFPYPTYKFHQPFHFLIYGPPCVLGQINGLCQQHLDLIFI